MRFNSSVCVILALIAFGGLLDRQSEASKPKEKKELPACPARFDNSLASDGIARQNENGLTNAKSLFAPEAMFSDQARKEIRDKRLRPFNGTSLLSLVVGVDGKPQNLCLIKSAGYGLDQEAAKAVWQYRFAPATLDGKPVPERISVEVRFSMD
jgi:protein TonB